ncbi:MAG: hypothetical protein O7E54_05650 [Planctomycetota bacterium]|nr:hypothetical protein [Planctomycetota bacterium]
MKELEAYRKHDVLEDLVRYWQETINVLAQTLNVAGRAGHAGAEVLDG